MKKILIALVLVLVFVFTMAACNNQNNDDNLPDQPDNGADNTDNPDANSEATWDVDVNSTASTYTNVYTNYDQTQLLEAISQYKGICTVATTNANGSPNLAIFVPGMASDEHIMFGWADNATKENFLRDKYAVVSYDVVDLTAETKEGRHQGAIFTITLEEDEAVLEEIKNSLPEERQAAFDQMVICRILEVKPIG